jgi:hypothetical protein
MKTCKLIQKKAPSKSDYQHLLRNSCEAFRRHCRQHPEIYLKQATFTCFSILARHRLLPLSNLIQRYETSTGAAIPFKKPKINQPLHFFLCLSSGRFK